MGDDVLDRPSQSGAVPNLPLEKPKGKPKTFKCPACAGTITVKAVGIAISAVCASCSSVIDITDENYRIIEKASRNTKKTLLEIGCRGRLDGIEWEVIGYLDKTDGSGKYSWEEYLLYNPYQGFRFLVHDAGHWNFVKVLRQDVPGAGTAKDIVVDDRPFTLFLTGESIVQYVKGEFYWRVRKGECAFVADYIAPPGIVSVERSDQEINVSLGEYINSDVIADAFAVKEKMPRGKGVAPNQPAPYQGEFGKLWFIAAVALFIAFAIQATTAAVADKADVYANRFLVTSDQKDQTITSESFNIPKDGNIEIQSSSPLMNDWVELDLSLVNEQTSQEYELKQAIEYYEGYDGGEHWSEGSQSASNYISRVPAGNYRLVVDMDAGAFRRNNPVSVSLAVVRDVPCWSNFWIAALSLCIYPLYVLAKRWRFEKERWSESDYPPLIFRNNEE